MTLDSLYDSTNNPQRLKPWKCVSERWRSLDRSWQREKKWLHPYPLIMKQTYFYTAFLRQTGTVDTVVIRQDFSLRRRQTHWVLSHKHKKAHLDIHSFKCQHPREHSNQTVTIPDGLISCLIKSLLSAILMLFWISLLIVRGLCLTILCLYEH